MGPKLEVRNQTNAEIAEEAFDDGLSSSELSDSLVRDYLESQRNTPLETDFDALKDVELFTNQDIGERLDTEPGDPLDPSDYNTLDKDEDIDLSDLA